MSKRKVFPHAPFHQSIVAQLGAITSRTKDGVAQAACLAALVSRTTCPPAHCAEVKAALSAVVERLGGLPKKGMKKKLFTTAQIAKFNAAFEMLNAQEKANVLPISGAGQSGAEIRTGSGSGERAEEAPRAAVG